MPALEKVTVKKKINGHTQSHTHIYIYIYITFSFYVVVNTHTHTHVYSNCLQKGVVYQATVTQTNTMREDIYIGITENEFKTRYNQHTSSFRLSHKSSATSLSEHIWKLKENNTDHTVVVVVGWFLNVLVNY